MKLTTYPNNPLEILDSIFTDSFGAFSPFFEVGRHQARSERTRIEWFEDDNHYYARLDLPGVDKSELDLGFEKDQVVLKIQPKEQSQSKYRLQVPEGIESEGTEASLEKGILTLTLPKAPEQKPITIEVA